MAGKTIKQALADAVEALAPKVNDSLEVEVAKAVKMAQIQSINRYVYKPYKPKVYERRMSDGGLGDSRNIKTYVEDGKLIVENRTPPNPGGTAANHLVTVTKNLAYLIEYGHGAGGNYYDFFENETLRYLRPRPFIERTEKKLRYEKTHIEYMQKGMVRRLRGTGARIEMV